MTADVRIYTTRWCGYCFAAVRLLDRKKVRYQNIDVGSDPDKRRWLAEVTGRTTVPQVFINDRPVGGFTDLEALDERGELDRLLAG
ncbi:MAG TPA: glutaredoxin 3 [Kofleriaceae bacterium]|nr:glutaredoxin 3 [Kofleriaceae bacterium]